MIKKIKRKIYKKFFKEFHHKPNNFPASDITDIEKDIIDKVTPYTLTGEKRLISLIRAIDYLEDNNIDGSIVECGVWKGGSIMAALYTLQFKQSNNREIYLYDTFEGMSEPQEIDKSINGESAKEAYKKNDKVWSKIVCESPLDEVKKNIASVGYPKEKINFNKGKVEDTIDENTAPKKIALLRLDTDWYESTKHELNYLYPNIVNGGILIIDDYGHWEGCKKAVDEYIKQNNLKIHLVRVDYTCRIAVKNN